MDEMKCEWEGQDDPRSDQCVREVICMAVVWKKIWERSIAGMALRNLGKPHVVCTISSSQLALSIAWAEMSR